jgi:ribosomal protein S18 acetylase RimI-like enzyme
MTLKDYDEIRGLWQESEGIELSGADSRESLERFLERNPGLSLVARIQGKLVGAVLCGHDGRRGYIDHLAVKKEFRLQGIARSLVSRCLYNLMQLGIHKWHLFVQQDNAPAIEFWRRLGWAERVELVTMSKLNSAE